MGVDSNGSRLCFQQQQQQTAANRCCLFGVICQIIIQIFYFALPLLPTAAATVRLYKKGCIEYAQWNHFCVALYLILTYLPMTYLLLGDDVGAYTLITIAVAYACTLWVVFFLPIYLKKWVDFKW